MTAPASTAPSDPPLLEPESLPDVELSLERPESSPEPELPLDPELPETTLESRPPVAPLDPELPPELGAPPEAEDAPPPELEDELVVSPEPHAQKDAATTETAQGASARVEVFRRTRGQRAVCSMHVEGNSATVKRLTWFRQRQRSIRNKLTARRTARSPGPT
jgi:hypothetical protein